MRRTELGFAIEAAASEGWNPGLRDADAFFAADRGGFLVGLLDDTPIGCVSAVRYGTHFGFLGFYIVSPRHRGQGYGLPLWRAAIRRLGHRCIGLDGVIAQQNNYRRSGFVLAHGNVRYEWRDRPGTTAPTAGIVPLADAGIIADYDRGCFPALRHAFLDAWLGLPDALKLVSIADGTVRGYGVIRHCRVGWKIGPLFADDRATAESLLSALGHAAAPDEPVYLDVPDANPAALRLAADHSMQETFTTARMYRSGMPDVALGRCFGVTSFELG